MITDLDIFNKIKELSKNWRKPYDKKMPGINTQDFHTLALLYKKGEVTKKELTEYLKSKGKPSDDVQTGRQVKNRGWYVNNNHGVYTLISFEKVHPIYYNRNYVCIDWQEIKEKYNYMCATCGCKEGQEHRYYLKEVKLQKGHKDPRKVLDMNNIIPQCQFCNRQDKDRWVYDHNGRVIGVNNLKYMVAYLKKNDRLDELRDMLKI